MMLCTWMNNFTIYYFMQTYIMSCNYSLLCQVLDAPLCVIIIYKHSIIAMIRKYKILLYHLVSQFID